MKQAKKKPVKKKEKLSIVGMKEDIAHIIAMGTVKLNYGTFTTTKISLDLLDRALKTVKAMGGVDEVMLVFSQDTPLIIGQLDEKKSQVSGIIIANREDRE